MNIKMLLFAGKFLFIKVLFYASRTITISFGKHIDIKIRFSKAQLKISEDVDELILI